jgi:adenylosuccinate synthase
MDTLNELFIPGKLTVLLDQSAGSSGKGKLEEFISANSSNIDFVVNTFMHQASHIVDGEKVDGTPFTYCYKNLNSNAHRHEEFEKMYITQGAVINLESLLKEIQDSGIPREKIGISPLAGITTTLDKNYEKGLAGFDGEEIDTSKHSVISSGTTASGAGATLGRKIMRRGNILLARDVPELSGMICDTTEEILERLSKGQSGLLTVAQGFQLSLGLPEFYPYTTSRNVTVVSALNDCMLPVTVLGNVIINCRAHNIRINSKKYVLSKNEIQVSKEEVEYYKEHRLVDHIKENEDDTFTVYLHKGEHLYFEEVKSEKFPYQEIESNSGGGYSDQEEITWEQVEREAGIQIPTDAIMTSLTKLPRRVFTFSKLGLSQCIRYNQTPHKIYISLNFVNWIDGTMEGINNEKLKDLPGVSPKVKDFIAEYIIPVVEPFENVELKFLGTGRHLRDMIVL